MDNEKGLFLSGVTISLDPKVLVALTHRVRPGETLTVMGPSGSGKSTLLAYVAGFLDPAFAAEGRVILDGEDVTHRPAEERHLGILFQDPLLFPHMTVAGNLAFAIPREVNGREERATLVDEALQGIGLAGLGECDPETLSGGQKARVALARVLLSKPRALLLDEPFSKLDTALRQQMRELVFTKARDGGLPMLLVTHDEADAAAAGGPVARIGDR